MDGMEGAVEGVAWQWGLALEREKALEREGE